tara:strand:- start:294 stop:998 length:705 start_codon:yes stop_codon:yes gene_type:complete
MHLFPVTVIDDFFPNVQEVLDLAKSQEYERFGEANYPGVTSKDYINNFNPVLTNFTINKIVNLFWDTTLHKWKGEYNLDFQLITPMAPVESILNEGLVHRDDEAGWKLTGVCYLNSTSCLNTGTTFYEKKNWSSWNADVTYLKQARHFFKTGEIGEGFEKRVKENRELFTETIKVQSKPNRMLLFPSGMFHSQTNYGIDPRYTLRVFIRSLTVKSIFEEESNYFGRYPLTRDNV